VKKNVKGVEAGKPVVEKDIIPVEVIRKNVFLFLENVLITLTLSIVKRAG
jgi:hypothetical protein